MNFNICITEVVLVLLIIFLNTVTPIEEIPCLQPKRKTILRKHAFDNP